MGSEAWLRARAWEEVYAGEELNLGVSDCNGFFSATGSRWQEYDREKEIFLANQLTL